MPQGESINAEYIIQYLKDTDKRFQNLKKDKISLKEMHFQIDNARPHPAAATQHFLASRNINLVKQSPYSVRASQFRPPGEDYCSPADLKKAIQRSIRLISENSLLSELEKLKIHLEHVISLRGDYISRIRWLFIDNYAEIVF